jgi:malonyl-CoA O-methyltransferase
VTPVDHRLIRESFHRHSSEYDTRVVVQKRVTARLAALLDAEGIEPRRLLDVGCGTGNLLALLRARYTSAELTGLDLAPGMVASAREKLGDDPLVALVEGDAERLPFTAGSFDVVVSTSTYQWLDDLPAAFRQVFRVLRPGGVVRFALFGEGTLRELRESYAEAEQICGFTPGERTHRFRSLNAVSAALETAGFHAAEVAAEDEQEWYPEVRDVLRAVRGIGAGTAAAPVSRGLGERRVMLRMMEIYRESYGTENGVPATYDVVYGRGIRRS